MFCSYKPGVLSPSDLERMAKALGYNPEADLLLFAAENLAASDGALFLDRATGTPFRVRTLVPQLGEHGGCKFFSEGRCTIHDVSPFGCAYFSAHMDRADADRASLAVHAAISKDDTYQMVWSHLRSRDIVPKTPLSTANYRIEKALRKLK